MDMQLNGKVAVISGGSVGIGLAVAQALAREGVHLALVARGEERLIDQAAAIARDYGVKAIGIKADVSKADDIERVLSKTIQTFEGIDILINNAGTGSNETVVEAPDEKWQYYWDLHVMAAVRLARGFAPSMRQRGGGIIIQNASICAKQPLFYEPIYNTTKAALMMFSKCLANELIKDNIRVNCINPGLILTPDWKKTASQLTAGTDQTADQYLDKLAKNWRRLAGLPPLKSWPISSFFYVHRIRVTVLVPRIM